MKSNEFKKTMKQTFINKYGVDHQMKISEVKQKIKETNLIKYGVEHNSQNEDIKKKKNQTMMQKYGVEYMMQSNDFKEKSKKTCLEKYGVEYMMQSNDFKEKSKKTCLEKYGVEYVMQNSEIAEKQNKSSYSSKIYTCPSGNKIKCQGYEPFALDKLIKVDNINENDIVTRRKFVPEIWYYNDEKKHRHYVDIFLPLINKCIEVKSTWTFQKETECIFLKQNAAKELGYNYEIWVYDGKGNIVNKYY